MQSLKSEKYKFQNVTQNLLNFNSFISRGLCTTLSSGHPVDGSLLDPHTDTGTDTKTDAGTERYKDVEIQRHRYTEIGADAHENTGSDSDTDRYRYR